MVSLTSLWIPILVSAVVVFFASFIVHMVLPFHRADFRKLPAEDEVMDALRRFNLPPGDYMVPKPGSPADMRSKAFLEKLTRGPVFVATIFKSGPLTMGPQLVQWFVFCLVVSLFAGYIASRALAPGAEYLKVSQIASTTAFLGYVMARWADAIWYKRSMGTMIRSTIDGILYGLLTGGVFGWLWPH
jgi:hypothetical protein